jgi:folate-dependent phosphoribosylglycinamide formyltransferase PurN
MTRQSDYRVLLLTSDPFSIPEITKVGEDNFDNVTVLFWAHGDMASKARVLQEIEATDYNLIISYINGIVLQPHHLEKAHFGAINIHPAPPEHGGVWGLHCQPVISRVVRTHHGVTMHEVDEDIDHGAIYRVKRWDVDPASSIESVARRSFEESFDLLKQAARELSQSPDGTRTFSPTNERWDPTNRHHTVEDVRRWFGALDPSHPAHGERVAFNHPRGTFSPPYFDDLPSLTGMSARIQWLRSRAQLRTRARRLRVRLSRPR